MSIVIGLKMNLKIKEQKFRSKPDTPFFFFIITENGNGASVFLPFFYINILIAFEIVIVICNMKITYNIF